MAVVAEFDYQYEGSDECSESELLDKSLSVWRGWQIEDEPDFKPIPLDLHTAASIGQYDHVWSILDRHEEDINKKNVGGWTPLMYACYIGHDTIVSLLIEAGANVNVKNGKGQSPLMLSASCGNESVTFVLLQAKADIEGRDRQGWTALFHATYSGHQNMVKFLLDNKANPEAKEPSREFTPFMEAAAAGHEIIVQCFLQHGVEVNAKSLSGDTARSLAMATGYTKIVSLIDNHLLGPTHSLRPEPSLDKDLSSSDENFQNPMRPARQRRKLVPSVIDGPMAMARKYDQMKQQKEGLGDENMVPPGYIQFKCENRQNENMSSREMVAPIRPDDHKDEIDSHNSAFMRTDALTMKSSSSTSSGVISPHMISKENSLDSSDDCDVRSTNSDPGQDNPLTDTKRGRAIRGKPFTDDPQSKPTNYNHRKVKEFGMHQVHSAPEICNNVSKMDSRVKPPPGFPSFEAMPMNRTGHVNSSNTGTVTMAAGNLTDGYNVPVNPTDGYNAPSQQVISGLPQLLVNLSADPAAGEGHNKYSQQNSTQDNISIATINNNNNKGNSEVVSSNSSLSVKARQEQKKVLENRPQDLEALLEQLGLTKYMQIFDEQDVDLQVFLTLTDNELKEVGIKLFGPRRKMTNAITRWHINAHPASADLEQAYADKLMVEVQEIGVQLSQATEQCESLKNQLLQEQELRSVAEGALMEDRITFRHIQRLACDSRQRCDNMKDLLLKISLHQSELARRFGAESPFSRSGSHGREGLAKALTEKLLIAQQEQDIPPEIPRLPTQQIIRRLEYWYDQLATLVGLIETNTDKLLGREMEGPACLQNSITQQSHIVTQEGMLYDYNSPDS